MNYKSAYQLTGLVLTALLSSLLAGCSTTSAIPDEEQLYTGIGKIKYTDDPADLYKKASSDSAGVITALANAYNAVSEALEGRHKVSVQDLANGSEGLTKAEKKALKEAQKRDEADFATAKEEVEAVLAYPPNNSIFGSSSMSWPLQIGLWIHNGFYQSEGKLGKWIYKTFGTEPVLVSAVSPEMRVKVATNTLRNYGYFGGKVNYDVATQKSNPKKAKINYTVRAGNVYRLDSVAYLPFPGKMDSILGRKPQDRLLKRGDAFSVVNLSNEQTRIESLLRNHGYYYFNTNYTTFRADTLARPGFVQLQVLPQDELPAQVTHPWYIGHTTINVRRSDTDVLDNHRTRRNYSYYYSGKKMPLRQSMWRHAIAQTHGEPYSTVHHNTTLEKLGAMGVLSQMDINYVPRDTAATCDTLDMIVTAVMDKLYDSSLEMNATFKSNQQVGPGISYELAKRNAFRGGEKVSFKIFGSYEWQTGAGSQGSNSLLNSYELGGQLAFRFPRFILPFVSRRKLRFPASTEFTLESDWKNRSKFYNMINMSLNAKYHWYKRETAQHDLTLLSLTFDKLNHTTHAFDSIMAANPALYVSMRNQFIPSASYTFTYQSRNWRQNPWWAQFSLKEAGNLTAACYALAGKKFNEKDKKLLGSPFAQYVRLTAEIHKLFRFTKSINLATRLAGGVIYSYGNSNYAPYFDQFYVGGANSIRAFTVRSIGPGRFRPADTRYAYMDQTGDVKLEGNIELRANLFGDLYGAVFLDAGNVWTLRDDPNRPGGQLTASTLKNIALGTGAGLRYDLDFLVLRFDVGVALHAPYQTSKPGFYNIERFKDGIGLHFAIGYPF